MKKKMILRINLSKTSKEHKSTHSLPFDLSSGRKERLFSNYLFGKGESLWEFNLLGFSFLRISFLGINLPLTLLEYVWLIPPTFPLQRNVTPWAHIFLASKVIKH